MAGVAGSVAKKAFIVSSDQARRFLDDYLGGRIRDPDDPRGTGMRGAYPGIWDRSHYALPRLLYSRVGIFRTIVDRPADDIWGTGWELISDSKELDERVRMLDQRLQLRKALRLATRMARRDGCALVRFRLRDATGDASLPPTRVQGILKVEALSRDCIEKVDLDEDPESDTLGEPLFFHLRTQPPTDYGRFPSSGYTASPSSVGKTTKVHRDRVLLVVQHPKEGSEWDGDSVLSWLLGDAQGHENVKWAAAEGYLQRNVPPLVVKLDPEVNLDPDNPEHKKQLDDLDKKTGDLVSGLAQKIRIGGATLEPLIGAERINAPDTYARMFLQELAGGARIPQREIVGDAAGALAAASWDTKRYFSDIGNDRDDFATPLLLGVYKRYDEWGIFPGLSGQVRGIHWMPHLDLSEEERARVLSTAADAVQKFRSARVPIPVEVEKLVTWPEGFDPTEILEPEPSPFGYGGPPGGPEDEPPAKARAPPEEEDDDDDDDAGKAKDARAAPRLTRNLRIEVSPKLRKVEDRLETALREAYDAWRKEADEAIEKAAGKKLGLLDRLLARPRRNDPTPRQVEHAIADLAFDSTDLEEAIRRALLDAAELGLMRTWEELGREGKVREFVRTGRADAIREFARTFSEAKAKALTKKLADTVADVLAKDGGIQDVRDALRDTFGVLENEATIARTEAMRGWNNGSLAAMQEAGLREWEFTVYDGACEVCAPLEGRRFPVHDTTHLPPSGTHPNCRCVPTPVVPEDA